jgi:hypothetical protein
MMAIIRLQLLLKLFSVGFDLQFKRIEHWAFMILQMAVSMEFPRIVDFGVQEGLTVL